MKPRIVIGVVIVIAFLGCAAQQDIVVLDDRIAALDQRVRDSEQHAIDLENQLSRIRSQLDAYFLDRKQEDLALRDQAAVRRVDMDRLREEIQVLTGLSEENRYLLKQKIASLEESEKKRDLLLEQIEAQNLLIRDRLTRMEEYLHLEYTEKTKTDKKETGSSSTRSLSEKDLYASAKQAFDKGDFEASRKGFEKFLAQYSKSDWADNAQFWIGEIYYREKWYEKSILEYQKVIEKFPKGNKVPAAMLKQGFAFLHLEDKTNSRLILKELVRKFPVSNEAKIAGEKLKEI